MNLSLQDLVEIALQYHIVDGGHCVTPKYYEGVKLSYKSRIAFLDYHFPAWSLRTLFRPGSFVFGLWLN